MLNTEKRKYVDTLIKSFWKYGYMTVKRKYGTYLPEPERVGGFEIDVVARQKKDYAIGITLSADEMNDPKLLEKITFLATRQTKFSNRKVMLFLGIPSEHFGKVKQLVDILEIEVKKNIKLVSIAETNVPSVRRRNRSVKTFFA